MCRSCSVLRCQSWRRQTAPTVAVVEKIAEIRQFMDKVVARVQQQVLVVTVQKTAEVPHMQFIDEFVAVPVGNLQNGGCDSDRRSSSHKVVEQEREREQERDSMGE